MAKATFARRYGAATHDDVWVGAWWHLDAVERPCPDAIPLEPPTLPRPFISGEGPIDYRCARCFCVLAAGIAPRDLVGLVLRCGCGELGRVPPS